jgi:hypothetical protein
MDLAIACRVSLPGLLLSRLLEDESMSLVKTTTAVATLGVFLISGLPIEAQEATPHPDLPALRPLQRFVGAWDQQVVIEVSDWAPENTTMAGDVTASWILSGRVIEHRVIWSPDNRHGLALVAYDTENKVYRQWYFDSSGTIPRERLRGEWDEATETITWKGRLPGGITVTGDHRFLDEDTFEWSLTHKDRTGKVILLMAAKSKRKPSVTQSDAHSREGAPPPPEMKLLGQMVGTWQESNVSRVAEWTPQETRGRSTLKVVPILGGHFVRCEFTDGEREAMMIRTFDPEQQAYRQWTFHLGSCGVESRGQWDDVTNTLTLTDEGQSITSIGTIWFSDKDTTQWSFISRDRQGKVYLDVIGRSVRQR